mgnify:CR=1 FL=1
MCVRGSGKEPGQILKARYLRMKGKMKRMVSGLLTAVTLLSTFMQPIAAMPQRYRRRI